MRIAVVVGFVFKERGKQDITNCQIINNAAWQKNTFKWGVEKLKEIDD